MQADALATFIENMRGLADGIRWVRRTNLHLTLRFLGRPEAARRSRQEPE